MLELSSLCVHANTCATFLRSGCGCSVGSDRPSTARFQPDQCLRGWTARRTLSAENRGGTERGAVVMVRLKASLASPLVLSLLPGVVYCKPTAIRTTSTSRVGVGVWGSFFGVPAALRCQRTLAADELLRSSRWETLQIVRGGNDVLTLKFTVHLKCSLSPALMPIPCLMRTLVVGLGRVCVTAILGSRKPSRGTVMGIHGSSPLFTKSLML